ncbi:MAG: IS66 family transposase [Thiohalospira sp.]
MDGPSPAESTSTLPATPLVEARGTVPFDRQGVWLTKREHIELKSEVGYWKKLHARAVEREKALEKKLEQAQGEIRDLRQRLYGRKSEKSSASRDDRRFVGEATSRRRGQQKDAAGHGRTPRPYLPVEEEVVDLPEGVPCCSTCHAPYLEFPRTEDSDVIEVKVRPHVRRYKRKMYRRGCQCEDQPGLITAPAPPRLLPRSTLGVSVWAEVLLDKFLYSRPTHRLLRYYASAGLPISPGTVTDGLRRLAPLFEPLIAAMHQRQMSESLFYGDETRWMVYVTVEGKSGHRWYLWVTLSESVHFYRVASSRAAHVPQGHFADLDESVDHAILVCDRYSAYKRLAKDIPALVLAFCWAHVRRDFIDAARRYPEEKTWMLEWLEVIRGVYRINRQRRAQWDPDTDLDEQSPAFAEHHQALIEALKGMERRRDESLRQQDLSTPRREVLTSLKNHWAGLTVFVPHPQVPMDNNAGERGVRKAVLGRNAYQGSASQWSAHLMAGMLTLLHTLGHWGINARHWLYAFLHACAANGGQCPDDLEPFLPWTMSEARKRQLEGPLPDLPEALHPPDTS